MMLYVSTKIKVDYSSVHGRGVFATDFISQNELIEECHFIKLEEKDFNNLEKSIRDILFTWPVNGTELAIVLGFGSIYNHSDYNNASWRTDMENNIFSFYATRDIFPGDEIFTNYRNFN